MDSQGVYFNEMVLDFLSKGIETHALFLFDSPLSLCTAMSVPRSCIRPQLKKLRSLLYRFTTVLVAVKIW